MIDLEKAYNKAEKIANEEIKRSQSAPIDKRAVHMRRLEIIRKEYQRMTGELNG